MLRLIYLTLENTNTPGHNMRVLTCTLRRWKQTVVGISLLLPFFAMGADESIEARAVAQRIVANVYFQQAIGASFLPYAKERSGMPASDGSTVSDERIHAAFNVAFVAALVTTFSGEELLALEPIYTTPTGLRALGKMSSLTTAVLKEFRQGVGSR